MLTMMFAQRFIESFRVRDRKAISNGTNNMIAFTSTISAPIFVPCNSPAIMRARNPTCAFVSLSQFFQGHDKRNPCKVKWK